jgi:hypothetical protein
MNNGITPTAYLWLLNLASLYFGTFMSWSADQQRDWKYVSTDFLNDNPSSIALTPMKCLTIDRFINDDLKAACVARTAHVRYEIAQRRIRLVIQNDRTEFDVCVDDAGAACMNFIEYKHGIEDHLRLAMVVWEPNSPAVCVHNDITCEENRAFVEAVEKVPAPSPLH